MQHGHLIPPIIEDLLKQLNDPHTPVWSRDTICERLEQIEKACHREIAKFRTVRDEVKPKKKSMGARG